MIKHQTRIFLQIVINHCLKSYKHLYYMSLLSRKIKDEKNISMIIDITLNKIYSIVGISLDRDESIFINNFLIVLEEIVSQEEKGNNQPSITKINGIIIKEAVNYIIHCMEDNPTDKMSTLLDDNDDIDQDEIFEDVGIEKEEDVKSKNNQVDLKPLFEDEIYSFDAKDLHMCNNIYENDISLKNIKYMQILSCSIDNSDYIINEYNNTFAVDNIEIVIKSGNYTAKEISDEINEKIDDRIEFGFDKTNDSFFLCCRNSLDEKSYNIDFGTVNTASKVLGFIAKSYKLKSSGKLCGEKHSLCYNRYITMKISNGTHEISNIIIMNVPYNNTKHYIPETTNIIKNDDGSLYNIDKLSISFTNDNGFPYNTRNRNFTVLLKINQLKN
jgi:hypothetical protein